jgi:zinc/manganese transport system permease protein
VIECVDPLFLRTMGRAGAAAHLAFLALVVINLISAFHALGTLLAVGLMILPAALARFWSRDISAIIAIAVLGAAVSGYFGLLATFYMNVPAGPAIVLVAGVVYFLSMFLGPAGGILRRVITRGHLEA